MSNQKVCDRKREERISNIEITCVPEVETLRGKKIVIKSIIN